MTCLRVARRRRLAQAALAALPAVVAGCHGEVAAPTSDSFPVTIRVTNALLAPITVAIDGAPQVILTNGRSSGITVPSTAQWLTWTSAKPMDAQGHPIPDDIGEVKVAISGINRELEIANIIGDQPYITASLFNDTRAQVSIGVYDGSSVSCAAVLPAASGIVSGFVQIGYYRLLPATEVRAYRDPSACTGPYIAWPRSKLVGYAAKSGQLYLTLDKAP